MVDVVGSYSVEVTSEFGCTSMTEPISVIALNMNEQARTSLAIIPNPFATEARLLFSDILTPEHHIELIDIHGRVVRRLQGRGSKDLVVEREHLS